MFYFRLDFKSVLVIVNYEKGKEIVITKKDDTNKKTLIIFSWCYIEFSSDCL